MYNAHEGKIIFINIKTYHIIIIRICPRKDKLQDQCHLLVLNNQENLGYKTFRKYTTKPELISDSHMRKCEYVDIAYERVLSFLDNCDEHYHDIVSDLEFNYRLLAI